MSIQRNLSQPNSGALLRAEPFDQDISNQWTVTGTIVSVNAETYTCDVQCDTGNENLTGIAFPYLDQDPEGGGGQVVVPRIGAKVIVRQGVGFPVITQILPMSMDVGTDQTTTYSVGAAGATVEITPEPGMANFRGRMPAGLLPGDWLRAGNQGQHLGVLDGGTVILHAAPWSQVVASQADDTLNVVGRNLNILTGFGELSFKDSGGKQSVTLRGGTDQMTETGPGVNNWTVEAQIGGQGTSAFSFKLRDRVGNDVYRKTIGFDGSVSETASGALSPVFKKDIANNYEKSLVTNVSKEHNITVGGDSTENFNGSLDTTVSQNWQSNVLQDKVDAINRDHILSIGRTLDLSVGGNILAVPGDAAAQWSVANGSLVIDIGGVGDLQKSNSSFKVTTFGPGGNIELDSLMGSSVLSGSMDAGLTSMGHVYTDATATMLGSKALIRDQPVIKGAELVKAFTEYLTKIANAALLAYGTAAVGPSKPANQAAIQQLCGAISTNVPTLNAALLAALSKKVFTV